MKKIGALVLFLLIASLHGAAADADGKASEAVMADDGADTDWVDPEGKPVEKMFEALGLAAASGADGDAGNGSAAAPVTAAHGGAMTQASAASKAPVISKVMKVLHGVGKESSALAFVSESKLAVGYKDGTIKIFNLNSGTVLCVLPSNPDKQGELQAWSLAASLDGKVASLHRDETNVLIRIWDGNDGRHLRSMRDPKAAARGIACYPDKDNAWAAGSEDGVVKTWQVSADKCSDLARVDSQFYAPARRLAYMGDNKFAVGGSRGKLAIVNMSDGESESLKGPSESHIACLATVGDYLVVGYALDSIYLYNVKTAEWVDAPYMVDMYNNDYGLACSSAGLIAKNSADGDISIHGTKDSSIPESEADKKKDSSAGSGWTCAVM